jgi:hypothetical protein
MPGARATASDRAFSPRWATKVSKLTRWSAAARCAVWSRPRIGQAGLGQVDGPAQRRVGLRLEGIGPGQAPVELILGWSQGRYHPQGAVHAQLVGAVITAPGLRRDANADGEPGAVPFHRTASLPRAARNVG